MIQSFQNFLNACEFLGLDYHGSSFTWSNKQANKERNDKVVATVECKVLF